MTLTPGFHALWPTPLGVERFARAAQINPLLVRIFTAMRAASEHERGEAGGAFHASEDDLLRRIDLPEWSEFVAFVVQRLQATMAQANRGVWPAGRLSLKVEIAGMWFQIGNHGAYHDVHNHGNCSWCGVYYVQIDPPEARHAHPAFAENNGRTRFYGPYLPRLGGAHMDLGNAYLQRPHVDVEPEEGILVVFPAYLEHHALPYAGERDRIVVSFNAALHASEGSDRLFAYAAG